MHNARLDSVSGLRGGAYIGDDEGLDCSQWQGRLPAMRVIARRSPSET